MTDDEKMAIKQIVVEAINEQLLTEGARLHDWMDKIDERHMLEDCRYRIGRALVVCFGTLVSCVLAIAEFHDIVLGWMV